MLIRCRGRELKELVFKDDNRVAGFRAIDLFDDGSFYLLDVPGVSILLLYAV